MSWYVHQKTIPKTKKTNEYLKFIDSKIRSEYNAQNVVYIAHGAQNLDISGSQTFLYVRDYLKLLNPRNFFYTIEGTFGYEQELLLQEIQKENLVSAETNSVVIVPLLLVAGNHSKNDIQEIRDDLNQVFSSAIIPENFLSNGEFSLLKLQETRNYFNEEIQEALKKVNW